MIVNRKYVLAHTPNIRLKRSSGGPVHLDLLEGLGMGWTGNANGANQAGTQSAQTSNVASTSLVLLELGIHDFQIVSRVERTRQRANIQVQEEAKQEHRNTARRNEGDDSSQWESIDNDYSAEERYSEEAKQQQDKDTLADRIAQGTVETRELLFLQSQANIIEKTLGEGEVLKIRPECLVAFASTVKLSRTNTHDFLWFGGLIQFNGLSSKSKFLSVKGPGLVYIDMK